MKKWENNNYANQSFARNVRVTFDTHVYTYNFLLLELFALTENLLYITFDEHSIIAGICILFQCKLFLE